MIGYATIGSNNLERAKGFYDAVLKPLGGQRAFASDRMQGWAGARGAMLAVCTPYDGQAAQPGNGNMVALASPSNELVDEVYGLAIASGATDEGAPGARSDSFYGAYFRDLDGNKVCIFKMG
ncbi:MAG TPA: VOC family protein [Caulobacteraceae bacterium]|nr:VOC family protein [Caulobacteraceae bacterium]